MASDIPQALQNRAAECEVTILGKPDAPRTPAKVSPEYAPGKTKQPGVPCSKDCNQDTPVADQGLCW